MDVKTDRSIRAVFLSMDDFVVHVSAGTQTQVAKDAMRLRHQVFCVERQFEEEVDSGLESDGYDESAHHLVLYCAKTGQALGCTRLVNSDHLPTERYISADCEMHPSTQERRAVAEVSRLLISKEARSGLPFLVLVAAMIVTADTLGLYWIYACMEHKLSKRLSMLHGLEVVPVSNPFTYRGERCVYSIQYQQLHACLSQHARTIGRPSLLDGLVVFSGDAPVHVPAA